MPHAYKLIIQIEETDATISLEGTLGDAEWELLKEFNHPYFRGLIVVQREMYNGKRLQEQFEITSNDVLLNSEEVLQQWLNAYEFHRDKKKKSFIDSLHQLLPLEASKAIFLSLLTEKARAANNVGLIVRVILGKQKQVTGRSRRPPDR